MKNETTAYRASKQPDKKTAQNTHKASESKAPSGIDPTHLTAADILRLQRTIGNQAVQRLLNKTSQAGIAVTPLRSDTSLQRDVMSFKDFQKKVKSIQDIVDPDLRDSDLSGERAEEEIKQDRVDKGRSAIIGSFALVGIMQAYENYQAHKNWEAYAATPEQIETVERNRATDVASHSAFQAMIDLYHTITLWRTLNENRPSVKHLLPVLQQIMKSIEAEVKTGPPKTKEAPSSATGSAKEKGKGKGKGKEKEQKREMPNILKGVGVPEPWFEEQIAPYMERLRDLTDFVARLLNKDAAPGAAETTYQRIKDVPGMPFIRSIILSGLPDRAGLQGIVGTEANSAKITPEEEWAILFYTTETGVDLMNNWLRSHKIKPPSRPAARPGAAPTPNPTAIDPNDVENVIRLAVSGLNKLPKHTGMVWRVLLNTPANYLATIHPGGLVADLGFTSASPSVQGTKYYKEGGSNQVRAVYFMIHTRTAVNIATMSSAPKEGEVLFRPGTRFQVQAVWQHIDGKVPKSAPPQAKMLLYREGEEMGIRDEKTMLVTGTEKVKVVEVIEV